MEKGEINDKRRMKFITDCCHFVHLGLNDVFCFAGSDGEPAEIGDIDTLVLIYEKHEHTGIYCWAAIQRGYSIDDVPYYISGEIDVSHYKHVYKEVEKMLELKESENG